MSEIKLVGIDTTTGKKQFLKSGDTIFGGGISSIAPQGHYKVTNIYVNAQTGKLIIEYET